MVRDFKRLKSELKKLIPSERIFDDALRTFAYGTDASFYRLIPKLVIKVVSEHEVVFVIRKCNELNIPITFRASGTSLSGQSISESVLLIADRSWNQINISENREKITLQPAVLGGRANLELNKYNKKIGPDPASINSATVIGIAANNASGMTSGVKNNCYNTVADMRIVFANGSVLNTSDETDRQNFIESNRELIVDLLGIASEIVKNTELLEKIVTKYRIKNTTGYGINSFVDYQDPIEIIKHLMIGSEGTLGFISQITFNTVPSYANKATALIIFPDIKMACSAIPMLKKLPVDAAELMDRASLKSVENKKGLPEYLRELDKESAALLVETSAINQNLLDKNIEIIKNSLENYETVRAVEFTKDPKEYLKLWNVRKGLFPSVSKARAEGTTVVIEDINFETSVLADAVEDLQKLLIKHDYHDTIIWGHALSGNIHFVFAQDFNKKHEIRRYQRLMNDVVILVVEKYNGSLKAEHGTGRNMAPFVRYEWGKEIYELMVRTKKAFDPKNIFNPGVLINDDADVYVKNLKPTPIVNSIIDKCIDCGFCESNCPSKNLTLTPRQRISVWREISQLKKDNSNSRRLKSLTNGYNYQGEKTCATDGLCELSCPVDIDTGKFIKHIRHQNHSTLSNFLASIFERNFGIVTGILKFTLDIVAFFRRILGVVFIQHISNLLRKITFGKLPLWNPYLPKGSKSKFEENNLDENLKSVIYFPSCISRTMGVYENSNYNDDQATAMKRLLNKAGYSVIYPENLKSQCCGMPFASKGFKEQADSKGMQLYESLLKVSKDGQIPVVFDTSPCTKTFKGFLNRENKSGLEIYDSIEFISDVLFKDLEIVKKKESIAIHPTCSATHMELNEKMIKIAESCSENVHIPEDVKCCGFAGDRGFTYPELNTSALETLRSSVKQRNCTSGYSSSKTCEIGLSQHSDIEYNSIIYLVDECTEEINKTTP
ncbi:MAG: FAD-binding and (Fe-S)-binding domain-containing protein [Melioribacteraceae bacterium]|nr:FAD-binding and (Fe-S)-binding domain-containing protein [Melioribacteraceae bacterium]